MKKRLLLYCLAFLAGLIIEPPAMAQSNNQDKTSKSFYGDGRLKEVTHQGLFSGCGVPVGTDSAFSKSGKLTRTILYKHHLKNGSGCHDIITTQTLTTYYPNGCQKTVQHFQACYECTPVAVGTLEWYNSDGKLTKSEKK